jgi:hypothetical protein
MHCVEAKSRRLGEFHIMVIITIPAVWSKPLIEAQNSGVQLRQFFRLRNKIVPALGPFLLFFIIVILCALVVDWRWIKIIVQDSRPRCLCRSFAESDVDWDCSKSLVTPFGLSRRAVGARSWRADRWPAVIWNGRIAAATLMRNDPHKKMCERAVRWADWEGVTSRRSHR